MYVPIKDSINKTSQNTVQPPPVLVVRVDRLELVHLVEVPSLQSGSAASTLDPATVPTGTEGRGNQHLGAVPHTHTNGLRTTDPASASGSAFRTARYAAAF